MLRSSWLQLSNINLWLWKAKVSLNYASIVNSVIFKHCHLPFINDYTIKLMKHFQLLASQSFHIFSLCHQGGSFCFFLFCTFRKNILGSQKHVVTSSLFYCLVRINSENLKYKDLWWNILLKQAIKMNLTFKFMYSSFEAVQLCCDHSARPWYYLNPMSNTVLSCCEKCSFRKKICTMHHVLFIILWRKTQNA